MNDSTLRGRALSAFLRSSYLPFWPDHTYVEFEKDDGSQGAWPCHGRDSGGRLLAGAAGRASFAAAKCLAGPAGNALINYTVDGVCHQSANRILYAAGIHTTVSSCNGYRLSELMYGTYGRSRVSWMQHLKKCTAGAALPADAAGQTEDGGERPPEHDPVESERIARIESYYREMFESGELKEEDDPARNRQQLYRDFEVEMRISLETILGSHLGEKRKSLVAERRNELVAVDFEILARLRRGEIDFQARMELADQALSSCLHEIRTILGRQPFNRFFNTEVSADDYETITAEGGGARLSVFNRFAEQERPSKDHSLWPNFW